MYVSYGIYPGSYIYGGTVYIYVRDILMVYNRPLIVPCLPYVRSIPALAESGWFILFITVPCSAVSASDAMLRYFMLCGGTCWPKAIIARPAAIYIYDIRFKVADICMKPPIQTSQTICIHVNHTMCNICYIFINYIYIWSYYDLDYRPCCSHFLKEDGILINHLSLIYMIYIYMMIYI